MTSPADFTFCCAADFTIRKPGRDVAVTLAELVADTGLPTCGVPVAVTVSSIAPLSMSCCVVTYVAVQVMSPPTGIDVAGQDGPVESGPAGAACVSVSTTLSSVLLLPLCTSNVYVTVCPGAFTVVGFGVFVTDNDAVAVRD